MRMEYRAGLSPAELNRPGIYRIRNTINGKVYIGQAVNIRKKKALHDWHLREGIHDNHHLQASYRKHGAEAFEFSVVIFCDRGRLTENESAALEGILPELRYNQIGPVDSPNLGRRFGEEHKNRIGLGNMKPVMFVSDATQAWYPSVTSAASNFNTCPSWVTKKIKDGKKYRGGTFVRLEKEKAPEGALNSVAK